jgi:hypothetical protein
MKHAFNELKKGLFLIVSRLPVDDLPQTTTRSLVEQFIGAVDESVNVDECLPAVNWGLHLLIKGVHFVLKTRLKLTHPVDDSVNVDQCPLR